jgi:hypothetical protein
MAPRQRALLVGVVMPMPVRMGTMMVVIVRVRCLINRVIVMRAWRVAGEGVRRF